MANGQLSGKTALVTGSGGGLGLAIGQALAEAGCRVVLHGLESASDMQETCARLAGSTGSEVSYRQADLADPVAIGALMQELVDQLGGIDILVNNAVVRHIAPIDDFPPAMWDRALAVNLSAAFHTIRLSLPGMRRRRWGRIFNMSSVYGSRATAHRVDYVTTKSAILGLTRSVALEAAADGITCNALCPGAVHTPGAEARIRTLMQDEGVDYDEARRRFLVGKQPSGQFVESLHVAQLLVFLCGAAGNEINGAMLPMEGGWLAG
ncbi:SDR family NAD(P)-dependent oxidoreductase [Xylophilus sp. GOD-11R]|uniref:SDR family NAD(P)-dependent oxidoreductase n=1 Tax=Xylophilus sp. GOD-11R TaxID=3089814 RepID=UPI00298D45CA|nr:SDR family NAD(P)-dependent oxidoreductase [Xylophilus sp. GOD-11R]WPB55510.1 SDR family NAD(P)-dependent oxidoreductase [Xylophilus sp. GOD-11R]